jgi:flagellin
MVDTAEASLDEVSSILIRMRELAEQSTNGTYTDTDRVNMNLEFAAKLDEISRIANASTFNGIALLSSSAQSVAFTIDAR